MGRKYRGSNMITITFMHVEVHVFHSSFQGTKMLIDFVMSPQEVVQLFHDLILAKLNVVHVGNQLIMILILVIMNDIMFALMPLSCSVMESKEAGATTQPGECSGVCATSPSCSIPMKLPKEEIWLLDGRPTLK